MPSAEATFRIVRDLTLDVAYFPLWWYSAGLLERFKGTGELIQGSARSLQLTLWIRNIFTPMYGQYDWQSRLISIFMRCVQIIGRFLALVFFSVLALVLLGLYIFGPIALVLLLVYHGFLSGSASYGG
ncbi:MAG: hypothetical protein WC802_04225 [Patescibacteria group bacterium]|jgi:hypothetical protein